MHQAGIHGYDCLTTVRGPYYVDRQRLVQKQSRVQLRFLDCACREGCSLIAYFTLGSLSKWARVSFARFFSFSDSASGGDDKKTFESSLSWFLFVLEYFWSRMTNVSMRVQSHLVPLQKSPMHPFQDGPSDYSRGSVRENRLYCKGELLSVENGTAKNMKCVN